MRSAFRDDGRSLQESAITLVALAEIARRDGLLALERPVDGVQDGFLKRAMQMAIDGFDPETIRSVMQAELESTDLRHTEGKAVLESVGRAAPTFGMIGTLIGLVIMLGRMNDPAMIGPGMAVALLTTLYGLVLANVFCLPIARKLESRNSHELLQKTVVLEGVLAVQMGDHPRGVAQQLRSYLPPDVAGQQVTRAMSDRLMAASGTPAEAAEKPEAEPDRRRKLDEAA